MKSLLIFIIFGLFTACNLSNEDPLAPPSSTVDTDCNDCQDGSICFENQCCTPRTICDADQCGQIDDGCGSTIECVACGCINDNFTEYCPSRPCQTATACDAENRCVYEPVQCEGEPCRCDGEDCNEEDLRRCGDDSPSCSASSCNPSPQTLDGITIYENICVQPEKQACSSVDTCGPGTCSDGTCVVEECGTCNLGMWTCEADGSESVCSDIISPLEGEADCDDDSLGSTFVYLDHVNGQDASDSGSRGQPFQSLDAAMLSAEQRGAKGIVIRSGYLRETLLNLKDGISLYGGYSGPPEWKYNGGTLDIVVSTPHASGNQVAVFANNITSKTILMNLNIRSGDAVQGSASSFGMIAANTSNLVLENVTILAGKGADGTIGLSGADGANGKNGGAAQINSRTAGVGGTNLGCFQANGSSGGRGAARGDNPGMDGSATINGLAGGLGGAPESNGQAGKTPSRNIPLSIDGAGGTHTYEIDDNLYRPLGNGRPGIDGADGRGGSGGGGSGGEEVQAFEFYGGGGGGGGAGGCGGSRGTGGAPGGGSFGLFVNNSSAVFVQNSSITSSVGGRGGNGGNGGAPGTVGSGGPGSSVADTLLKGGAGGNGQAGRRGGHGGGGAGGPSASIFCEQSSVSTVNSTLEHALKAKGGTSQSNSGSEGPVGTLINCD